MTNTRLKTYRLNRGKTVRALAIEVDVPEHVLRHAETKGGTPVPETAFKIAEYFGVKVTDIWPVEATNGTGEHAR